MPTLAPLVRELQFRAPAHRAAAMGAEGAAVGQLVGECAAAWVAFRMGVLGAVVNAEIGRMDPSRGDLVDLVRRRKLSKASRDSRLTASLAPPDTRRVRLP